MMSHRDPLLAAASRRAAGSTRARPEGDSIHDLRGDDPVGPNTQVVPLTVGGFDISHTDSAMTGTGRELVIDPPG